MGHSSKHPWPNLKKLIVPLSTTARTTVFFPPFNATKAFGGRGAFGTGCGGNGLMPISERIRASVVGEDIV